MPIHDWTRVPAGLFHHFHQDWSIEIARVLNAGLLPSGVDALVEQRSRSFEADVLGVTRRGETSDDELQGGTATRTAPATRMVRRAANDFYAQRANRIIVRHHLGRILAILEIVSPGNKDRRAVLADFVEKTVECLRNGVHVLIVDLFPPMRHDPSGIHKAIWDELVEEEFTLPTGKDRLLVSYEAGAEYVAYIEPVGVGDPLPEMPLFLAERWHVMVPLESTYRAAWSASPAGLRAAVETGALPNAHSE